MIRLFRVFVPVGVLTLLLIELGLISCCFILAAYLFIYPDPATYLLYEGGYGRLAGAILTLVMAMHLQDLYSRVQLRDRALLFQKLCLAMGLTFLMQGLINYLSEHMRAPIRVMIPGGIFTIVLISVLRPFYIRLVQSMTVQRVLFVGGSALIEEAAGQLHKLPEIGLEVVGYVADEPDGSGAYGKILAPIAQLAEVVDAVKPNCIVIGMQERRGHAPMATLLDLRLAGYSIEEDTTFFERICGRVSCTRLRPSQLIFSGEFSVRQTPFMALFDFGVALAGVVLTFPVMVVIAAAIRLSSPGPVLYRQTRVGQYGAPFTVYKFRSMYEDAEASTGAVWSTADDPRITPVGRLIRKLRLDELPQLFNVLRGDMSIVGPRPERPEFVKVLSEKIAYYRKRHAVKPGITGWAQINYKYGDTFEDSLRKLEYDLYYIKHMSQSLNNYIIFATIKIMLLQRGAQ